MHFSSDVNPENMYMGPAEACRLLGTDQNGIRGLMLKKLVSWDMVYGKTMLYRASVEAYRDKLANAGNVVNPYQKKEPSNAQQPTA